MTAPDYSTWLTKQQAAAAIGVTTKSIERFVQEGKIQQARWRRPTGGPELAVYHPDDVARIAQERQPGPLPPFLVPASNPPTNGKGATGVNALAIASPSLPPGEDLLRLLFAAVLKTVSQTSETSAALYLTLPEAAAITGLSQAYLRRRIADQSLPAVRDRGWRIRRKDLEQL
jgi:excisionase family DNA binding protein